MKKIAILVSLMMGAVTVMAQTTGQFIVPVKTAGGRTETGVTLANGEVLGKSGGVPAAVSLSSYLTGSSALDASNLTSGTLPVARLADGSLTLSKLAASGATTGQVATWNGSVWAPATPSGGGGGLTNVASTITGGTLTLAGTLTTGRTLTVRDLAGTIALTSDLSAYLTTSSAASTYEPILVAGTTSQYYRGDKSWQTLNAAAVGLGNVSNALQLVAANNLSDLTNATTARSNLGLGTLATQNGTISDYLTAATAASTYEPILAAGTTGQYYRGDKSWQTLNAAAVGLGNVSNALQLVAANNLSDLANTTTARSNLGLGTLATQNGTISDYLTAATAASTYQPLDADLTSVAAVATTAFGRGLLAETNAATTRSTLGLANAWINGSTSLDLTDDVTDFYVRLVAPAGVLGDNLEVFLPASDILGESDTQTLANKTISGSSNTITNINASNISSGTLNIARIADGAVTNAKLAGSIAASKLVGTDIATVGTITSGTWTGTTIAIANGGTGATTASAARIALLPSMTGNGGKFLRVNAGATDYELATISGGGDALTANPLSQFASTTSSQFAGVISDETGTGAVVFASSPALTTPNLGTPSAATLTNATGLPLSTGVTGTLPIANGGTGQTSQTAAFDALAPTTTKGDLIVSNGTDNIRVPVGVTNGHVLTVDSAEASGVKWAAVSGGSGATDSQLYTSSSTWTNPSPSTPRRVFVRLVGGGGGGGSGRKGAAGSVRCGGGGGAAGSVIEFWMLTTELSSTASVTIGGGGTGGAAITADSTSGNAGNNGGDTTFASTTAKGGGGGGGGTAAAGAAGAALGTTIIGLATVTPQAGAAASGTGGAGGATGVQSVWVPTGGGAGGGITSGNSASAGGAAGGIGPWNTVGETAGGTAGATSTAGGAGNIGRGSGTGGGGGGGSTTTNAGAGGAGGGHGAGGGGGGAATDSVGNSGAGGAGAGGYALIITY